MNCEVKFHTPDGWREFVRPVAVLAAYRTSEVQTVLAEAARLSGKGCWVAGFVAYEAAPAFDAALVTQAPAAGWPLAWFAAYGSARPATAPRPDLQPLNWRPDCDYPTYAARIVQLRDHILAGDIYQANFTQRLTALAARSDLRGLAGDPQARYGAVIETDEFGLYSASPELFFECAGGQITCRPMKGTAARGADRAEDAALQAALAASAKNRAENLMITDLMRNDLGRIAVPGTVKVPELFRVETYPSLFQMTSTVTAQTRAGFSEIMAALFPCGSITGAPKVRAMQLIREMESGPRGVYTGALGYLRPDGAMRFSVAIRCAQLEGDRAIYGVGGGIVWDSTAESEWRECGVKAAVLGGASLGNASFA